MSEQRFKSAWVDAKSEFACVLFQKALAAGVPVLVMQENDDDCQN